MTDYNDRKNKRILLVDDAQDVLYTIKKVLENNGFVVESYDDPNLALSNFKIGLYDLLLLDIRMPKMNGFELYQKIREIDNNVKICFLTASELFYEEYRRLDSYPRLNKERYIQKPIRSEELIRQISEVLYSH
ncbi:MAG TPA: response regulator [Nitrososphaeraceae archaeon]|nr:response regulator [Nitrososphaeraceae archaeon]